MPAASAAAQICLACSSAIFSPVARQRLTDRRELHADLGAGRRGPRRPAGPAARGTRSGSPRPGRGRWCPRRGGRWWRAARRPAGGGWPRPRPRCPRRRRTGGPRRGTPARRPRRRAAGRCRPRPGEPVGSPAQATASAAAPARRRFTHRVVPVGLSYAWHAPLRRCVKRDVGPGEGSADPPSHGPEVAHRRPAQTQRTTAYPSARRASSRRFSFHSASGPSYLRRPSNSPTVRCSGQKKSTRPTTVPRPSSRGTCSSGQADRDRRSRPWTGSPLGSRHERRRTRRPFEPAGCTAPASAARVVASRSRAGARSQRCVDRDNGRLERQHPGQVHRGPRHRCDTKAVPQLRVVVRQWPPVDHEVPTSPCCGPRDGHLRDGCLRTDERESVQHRR